MVTGIIISLPVSMKVIISTSNGSVQNVVAVVSVQVIILAIRIILAFVCPELVVAVAAG